MAARSLYSPHPTYLDTSIVLTILITGCHASTDTDEMGGVIAGAIVAFLILVAAIAVIAYCIIKAQNSKKLQKQKMKQVNHDVDYGTRVLRKIPTGQRGYPPIIGYSDYIVGFQPPLQNPRISMMSRVATISHMPTETPPLTEGFYSISRPRKAVSSSRAKSIGDRESKHRSRSKKSESDAITLDSNRESRYSERWDGITSEYILQKRDDSYTETKPATAINGPYTLTSLFNQDPDPTGVYPKNEYTRTNDIPTTTMSYPSTYATPQPAIENPIVYPPKINSLKINSSKLYSPEINSPEINSPEINPPDMTNVEDKDVSEAIRPDYPDYDLESVMNEENAPEADVPKVDTPSPTTNKFSYAFTEELKQSSRFRASNQNIAEPTVNPFSSSMKQVQFTPSPAIETNQLNAGTYGSIPPAPPLPPP